MNSPANLSVVVASFRAPEVLAECLESLRPQCESLGAELIVARVPCSADERLGALAAGCRVVTAPPATGLPRLRGAGLAQAGGDWVAMTEDHCVADPGWLAALQAAGEPGVQVLGGRMGNARRERAVDCGAFFAEYGFYGARGNPPDATPHMTEANAAYHRSVIADVAAWAKDGQWENVIHDRLRAQGRRFQSVPGARVRQNLRYHLRPFCRDRFAHGRDFARARGRDIPAWRRMLLALGTPVLPLLLAARVARAADPEEVATFGRALPATLTFLGAWAAGEAVGYLTAGAPA